MNQFEMIFKIIADEIGSAALFAFAAFVLITAVNMTIRFHSVGKLLPKRSEKKMKDNKKHGVFWFFKTLLTLVLVIYTCVRCCMIVSDKYHANALDTPADYLTLTPAQTVALYGSEIQGVLYNLSTNSSQTITFVPAFNIHEIGYMNDGGGFSYNHWAEAPLDNTYDLSADGIRTLISDSSAVVYVASAQQWGGGAVTPYTYENEPVYVQLHTPLSVRLSEIGRFRNFYMISTKRNAFNQWPRTPVSQNKLTCLTDIANIVNTMLYGGTYAGTSMGARATLPTYAYYQDGNQLDENSLGYFSGWYCDLYETTDYDVPIDVTGFTIDTYGVSSVSVNSNDLWLVVGCPLIYGYEPPVITTTRPAETIPAATYPVETMPPAYTDTPQNILNQNLITNNYQLNLIIGQLNLIYNQLKINGELSAKLAAALDADNDPGLQFPVNTDIRQYMSDVIYQTGTEFVYSPEDLQTYSRAIPWLSSMFHGQTWFVPFAFLGTIGLIMIVFSYLVFRR